jgi:hypothetical protein
LTICIAYQYDRQVTTRSRKSATILPFGLPRPVAENLVRTLVAADEFTLEPKAKMNLRERDFTMRQILITLKEGHINQNPWRDECNDWRCRFVKRCAGRLVHVVVAIHDMRFVYVISVH